MGDEKLEGVVLGEAVVGQTPLTEREGVFVGGAVILILMAAYLLFSAFSTWHKR